MEPNQALVVKTVFQLQDECLALVIQLKEVILKERKALIGLDTETVAETNAKKDFLGGQLRSRRTQQWDILKRYFSLADTDGLENVLEGPDISIWEEKKKQWLSVWNDTKDEIASNQKFLKHSLKNFDQLAENLKRLLGEQPLYSSKGQRVDVSNHGKMVEAKY